MNWNVHLMPLRVLNGNGSGTNDDIAAAFASTCSTHPAQIVNASLGGTGYSNTMRNAIAGCPNVLFVVAAGNDGTNNDTAPHYPCNYGAAPDNLPNVICVAATDQNDKLASFSNYGASVDLAAPGVARPAPGRAMARPLLAGLRDPFTGWSATRAIRPLHDARQRRRTASADSPAGNYAPSANTSLISTPVRSRTSRSRSAAGVAYNQRLDTEIRA